MNSTKSFFILKSPNALSGDNRKILYMYEHRYGGKGSKGFRPKVENVLRILLPLGQECEAIGSTRLT